MLRRLLECLNLNPAEGSSLLTTARESLSAPVVAALFAAIMYLMYRPTGTKRLVYDLNPVGCPAKYCGPVNMFMDSAFNTMLKDQSLGAGLTALKTLPMPTDVYAKLQDDFAREQLTSPGVNLVAHAVD